MFRNQFTTGLRKFTRQMSNLPNYKFDTLNITSPAEFVYQVELNNPNKRNAMNQQFWKDIKQCFNTIKSDSDCRCVVLTGAGKVFSSGIDVTDFGRLLSNIETTEVSRRAFHMRQLIEEFQSSFTSLEHCLKPVIAAVHGACVGGAVDMICCADIRIASNDAWFQVKEVAMGLAADVGTLQRLPRLVGSDSLARELVYTARALPAEEAHKCGFVSNLLENKDALLAHAVKLASEIASWSPVAVQSSKAALIFSRDHSVEDGLRMQAAWNQVMLQSEDLVQSVMAAATKEKATFAKL